MNRHTNNIDAGEIRRFAAQSDAWWDRKGPYKALHEINPVRLAYVRKRAGLKGKRVLDVGCGGGLLAETMAAAGASVMGIDMAAPALKVARRHAQKNGLEIAYRQSTAEAWAINNPGRYNIVTCMELVEHVPDAARLVESCCRLVCPGGDVIFATVNRTWLARLLVIWASEYLLNIVPRKTHTYAKFIRPDELIQWGRQAGLGLENLSGLRYIPFLGHAALCRQTTMNYMIHFRKH